MTIAPKKPLNPHCCVGLGCENDVLLFLYLYSLSIPWFQLELKCQETQGLIEQRDQVVAHLQQYSAGYQAMASEREQLHQQYLQQCQLMDRLQHDESHGRVQLEISHNQLKQAQVGISQIGP